MNARKLFISLFAATSMAAAPLAMAEMGRTESTIVGAAVGGDGVDAQFAGGTDDANRNFTAIGNQQTLDRHGLSFQYRDHLAGFHCITVGHFK